MLTTETLIGQISLINLGDWWVGGRRGFYLGDGWDGGGWWGMVGGEGWEGWGSLLAVDDCIASAIDYGGRLAMIIVDH